MYAILSFFSTKDSRRPSEQIAAKWIAWRGSSHTRKMAASISVSQITVWINADAEETMLYQVVQKINFVLLRMSFNSELSWVPMCYRLSSFGQDMIQVFFLL